MKLKFLQKVSYQVILHIHYSTQDNVPLFCAFFTAVGYEVGPSHLRKSIMSNVTVCGEESEYVEGKILILTFNIVLKQ